MTESSRETKWAGLQRIFAPVFVVVIFLIFYLGITSRNGGSNSSRYLISTYVDTYGWYDDHTN